MRMMALLLILFVYTAFAYSGDSTKTSPNTLQYYSGKFGFYKPGESLNNGLLIGVDGITEFVHYNFFLSGAADVYAKQIFDIFENPQPNGGPPPDVTQQQMILIPLHVNFGYKLLDIADADTRFYLGAGGGYYLFFYSATYQSSSGGILGGGLASTSDSKNGGGVFGTIFARVLINKIFVEPRMYFASKNEQTMGGYTFNIDPSGFAITLGFQYH